MLERIGRGDTLAMIVIGAVSFATCIVLAIIISVRHNRAERAASRPSGRRMRERRGSSEQEREAVTASIEVV